MDALMLLLADSRFPAGGYAHSGGLEAAVEDGLGAGEVQAFVRGRLVGVAAAEAALSVVMVLLGPRRPWVMEI